MACPFFEPVEPRSPGCPAETAMFPLGDLWDGVCLADPARPFASDPAAQHRCCNFGYASGACGRFPAGDESPDAARFAIRRDDGERVAIDSVLERDHHPFAHAALEWSRSEGSLSGETATPIFLRQAEAYVRSYLRRKDEARGL